MSQELTIFALPKAMHGRTAIQQRNSIKSWLQLEPRPKVILFGQEQGVAELAKELEIDWHPQLECTRFGTPRVDDLFQKAEKFSSSKVLAYVNSDIILMNDFMKAVDVTSQHFPEFLMLGRRWNVDLEHEIDFSKTTWREELRELLQQKGFLYPPGGMDYFVFSRGLYPQIPAFGIGRTAWDCWLLKDPLSRGKPVIDATASVLSIHHNHDYSHIKGAKDQAFFAWTGEEGKLNQELAGPGYDQGTLSNVPLELFNFAILPRTTPYLESDFLRLVRESMVYGLGHVQQDLERKDHSKALKRLTKCKELKIDYPGFFHLQGVLENMLGNHQAAVDALAEELKRFPAQTQARELFKKLEPEIAMSHEILQETLPDLHQSELLALSFCAKQTREAVRLLDYSRNNEARFFLRFCLAGSEIVSPKECKSQQDKFEVIYVNANEDKKLITEAWAHLSDQGILMISSSAQQLSDFDLPEHCFLVLFENPRLVYSEGNCGGVYFLTPSNEVCEALANALAQEFPECLISRRLSLYSNIRRTTRELMIDRGSLKRYEI